MTPDSYNSEQQFQPDWLSAYLDEELDTGQRQTLESMLQEDRELRRIFDELVKTRSLLKDCAETLSLGNTEAVPEATPRILAQSVPDLIRNHQNDASGKAWLGMLDDGLESNSEDSVTRRLHQYPSAGWDHKKLGFNVRRLLVVAASLAGLATVSFSWFRWNRDRVNPPLAKAESSETLSEASDQIAVLSTMQEPTAEPLSASQSAPSMTSQDLSVLLQTGVERARQTGVGGGSSDFSDRLGSAKAAEAKSLSGTLNDSTSPGVLGSMPELAASSDLPQTASASRAGPGGITPTRGAEPAAGIMPTESSTPRDSQNIQWYRSPEWTELEMVLFRDAHPLLQTLNQNSAIRADAKPEAESPQEVDDILQAVTETLPVAIIRIPSQESRDALQIIQGWQLTPELAEYEQSSTPTDELLRVLFVAPDQVREFLNWFEAFPGNKVTWLAPSMAGLNSEKAILVLHFAAD